MSAPIGTYVLRQVTKQGRDFVCELPSLRHRNRLSEQERAHEKMVRAFQRMRLDDRKWADAMARPLTPAEVLRRLAARCARRSRVMYGRMAKGGVR